MSRLAVTRIFLVMSGGITLSLSTWGCFASIMLDYQILPDLLLILCFLLPFPFFLVSVYSLRWSASLLWALFLTLSLVRAFLLTPNPQMNPFDAFGVINLSTAISAEGACFFAPSGRIRRLGTIFSAG